MSMLTPRTQPSNLDSMDQEDERAALLALLLRSRAGWRETTDTVLEAGSAWRVLQESATPTDALFPLDPVTAVPELAQARSLLADANARGTGVHGFLDDEYPPQLRQIHEMPPVLFSRGELADDSRAIAVVGSRSASARGREIAARIAGILTGDGVTVVSGLAAGVDTAAHTGALHAGGRTVAVLGTGINHYYPRENRALQEKIATRGLLLSQFLPDAKPTRQNFPMRNAVMSGYAAATVVVEAGEHSGARTQARLALEHGRQVVLPQELLANSWARGIAERPGVHIVSGMRELTDTVGLILAETESEPAELAETTDVAW